MLNGGGGVHGIRMYHCWRIALVAGKCECRWEIVSLNPAPYGLTW
ncbi:hypothetical protein DESC_920026 [Desulfosarcina cetonica]|nr:hypothetical protein DESC_920026 [Desulfosarcina cetonica]